MCHECSARSDEPALPADQARTRGFLFEVANLMLGHLPHATPDHWPLSDAALRVAKPGQAQSTPTGVTP